MTRPADPRGADRRKPSEFGAETGLDIANDAPGPQRRQFQHKPRRVIPDCGCHGYDTLEEVQRLMPKLPETPEAA